MKIVIFRQLCDITDLVKDCEIEKVKNSAKQMPTCSVQTVNFKEAGVSLQVFNTSNSFVALSPATVRSRHDQ